MDRRRGTKVLNGGSAWAAQVVLAFLCSGAFVVLEMAAFLGSPILGFADEPEDSAQAQALQQSADDELTAEEAEEQRKIQEAQAVYDQAFEQASAAVGQLAAVFEYQQQLANSFEELEVAQEGLQEAQGVIPPLQERLKQIEFRKVGLQAERESRSEERAEAIINLARTDNQIARATVGEGLLAVVLGEDNITQAESNEFMLQRVAQTYADAKAQAEVEIAALDVKIVQADSEIQDINAQIQEAQLEVSQAEEYLRSVVGAGNAAAFAIEKIASEARQTSRDAIVAVEALDSEIAGVDELKQDAAGWDMRFYSSRVAALDEAGAFYDATDALVGLEGAIVYGTGLDFALTEKEFEEKWGAAIDAFFLSRAAPLHGYGKEMAKWAYYYKVDPRLCAAVSIVESSGGAFCIKPHNAWGWGAADSDPYNLASSWPSWEAAIEGWHKGMAESKTGLATTPSLTAMGDIYCSTPSWGTRVASFMEAISEFAEENTAH